jgi:hypothetical protein
MRFARWALAAALAALVVGCASGHTVVVQLQTDLAPGLEFDEVFVQATGVRSRRASLRDDYGRPTQVAEFRGVSTGTRFAVEVQLRLAGVPVLARAVERRIAGDAIVAVVVTRDCRNVTCPMPGAPGATECRGGVCVTPDCDDDVCAPPMCSIDTQCASPVACVRPRCVEGICLQTPDSTRCGTGEVCAPELGCVAAVEPDAGPIDASAPVPDASVPDDAFVPPDAWTPTPSFTLRHLPSGGSAWREVPVGGDFPTEPVEAAFAPAGTGQLVVLTRRELFVLDLATGTFVERRGRDVVLPELSGFPLQGAYLIGTDLYVTARDSWIYRWEHATRSATFDRMIRYEDLGADWRGPLAPPWWDMNAMAFVPDNADGWARPDAARSPCGAAPVPLYGIWLSHDGFGPITMMVSIYDGGCFQFVNQGVYGSSVYPPFAMPGAPPNPLEIRALEWSGGLWAFSSPG